MPSVACVGDVSDHGGVIISGSQTIRVNGKLVARHGDMHKCPIKGHGVTSLTSIATKSNLITVGARAGCGALIVTGSSNVNAL